MQTRRFCHCRGRGRNIYSHPLLSKFVEANFKTKPCNAIETKKLCRSWICRAFYRVGRGRERSGYNTLNFNRLARTLLCKPLIFKGLPPLACKGRGCRTWLLPSSGQTGEMVASTPIRMVNARNPPRNTAIFNMWSPPFSVCGHGVIVRRRRCSLQQQKATKNTDQNHPLSVQGRRPPAPNWREASGARSGISGYRSLQIPGLREVEAIEARSSPSGFSGPIPRGL